jgi:hypothetical protein
LVRAGGMTVRLTSPHRASSGQSTAAAQPCVIGAGWLLCGARTGVSSVLVRIGEDANVATEVLWDLLVFLALVAVGVWVLSLLARRR